MNLFFRGHYSVNLTSVEVGDSVLQLSPAAFDSRGVIVDSGTALVYLPDSVYMSLMNKVNTITVFSFTVKSLNILSFLG